MELGTLMLIELFAFFGGVLAFGAHQLHSLKRLNERDQRAEAEALANGMVPPRPDPVPGWMARR